MPINVIVTHLSPDLDAIASVWLLKRFDEQNFGSAIVSFVPAGDQISIEQLGELGYASYEVVHVDTGGGEFDHHTPQRANEPVCAASLVHSYICEIHPEIKQDKALAKMVEHFIDIDHFKESGWAERMETRHFFSLHTILGHLKSIGLTDEEIVEYGLVSLDAIHANLKSSVNAQEEIAHAVLSDSRWGKVLFIETKNPETETIALKIGISLVVRKDPEYKHMRILASPNLEIDLTPIYEKIQILDANATWYLHPAKRMLLNGSDKRRHQVATTLSLDEVKQLIINN